MRLQYAAHLLEVVLGELVCDAEQLATGVRVCECPDAQTVGGVQLPLEELAAGLLDLSQLEQAGSGEESLHIPLLHGHLGMRRRHRGSRLLHHCRNHPRSLSVRAIKLTHTHARPRTKLKVISENFFVLKDYFNYKGAVTQ